MKPAAMISRSAAEGHAALGSLRCRRGYFEWGRVVAVLAAFFPLAWGSGLEAGQSGEGWGYSGELSFVRADGNAESSTMGVANTVIRSWDRTEVKIESGGIRTRTTRFRRVAVGTASNYRIADNRETEVSAENYYLRGRIDLRFSNRTAVFVQSGWIRNTLAGVANRYVNVSGVSIRWAQDDRHGFRTGLGLTYTRQDDVVVDPTATGRFFGLQMSSEYRRNVTANTVWTSSLVVDGNGEDTSDLRGDWGNAVSVTMSERLGLKTNFRLLFDNQPSLASVPLESPEGTAAGTVLVRRRKLDRVLTVALVISL